MKQFRWAWLFTPHRLHVLILLSGLLPVLQAVGATTYLSGCFPTKGRVDVPLNYDLSAEDNYAGNRIQPTISFVFPSDPHAAQCSSCPGVTGTTTEKIYSYRTTPLPTGRTAKYGKLTNNLDIQISAFSDTVSGGGTAYLLETYPNQSPTTSLFEGDNSEATQSLCANSPVAGNPKRLFNWNKISLSLYIVNPIFGIETIPNQLLMSTSVCIFYGSGSCNFSKASVASEMYISGAIYAPLSCTINAGSTINVDFETLASSNFTAPGAVPSGFTLRDVDIKFHCDSTAVSNSDKIKLTLSADQGVNDTGTGFIAKMIGRDDIGVRMYDSNDNGIPLDGSADFPIVLDGNGDGHIQMTAAPVATTSNKPAAGHFEGNVTVKMDIR
ncbi:fimbrial protein [Citrobacter amalonaticus]|uniref:fimbrial protein n=1 Tax=Citrobacter amalonaticus TaxID=35703 RepID=UPI0004D56D57|nr:fimbrial protein [Citrobacter amalonaticus]KEY50665.1 hypothetical protein DQ02_03435 [Citrobacter amalonaticus]